MFCIVSILDYNKFNLKIGRYSMRKGPLTLGDTFTVQKLVEEEDTSLNYGSGELEKLFATPSLIALMIKASVELIDPTLEEGFISVGKSSWVIHDKPTILGETVSVKVTIKELESARIFLEMEAYDEIGVISRGTHERYIINKDSFFKYIKERAKRLESKDF